MGRGGYTGGGGGGGFSGGGFSSNHYGHYGSYWRDPGESSPLITVIAVIFVAVIGFGTAGGVGLKNYFEIERSTVKREVLPANLCQKHESWYSDQWGDWISYSSSSTLQEGLQYFYKKTGVQPYLLITGSEGAKYSTQESLDRYAAEQYRVLFGDDGGHLLVVFREYPNNSTFYIISIYAGSSAEQYVMDEQAKEILRDVLNSKYHSDLTDTQYFASSFTMTADRIMSRQLPLAVIIIIGVVIVGAVVGVLVFIATADSRAKKKKRAEEERAWEVWNANRYNTPAEDDEESDPAIETLCPKCGSGDITLPMLTVGYCSSCGAKIKVNLNGKATLVDD